MIIIIGHTGFIGKSIVESLKSKKIKHKGIATKECDLKKPQSIHYLLKVLKKDTILIITAAINRELGDNIDNMQTHIKMIANVAKAVLLRPIKKCVYLSTTDVYGRPKKLPINEETHINPMTYYATAKYCCEKILEITCQTLGIPLLILRYNGVYGPGQVRIAYGPNFFIKGVLEENEVMLWGDGKELRDSLYVKDLAKIIIELGLGRTTGIYNIATGKSLTFVQMVKILKEVFGAKFKIIRRKRTSSAFDQVFDISKLEKVLPKIYFTPIKLAIKQTLEFSQDSLDKKT